MSALPWGGHADQGAPDGSQQREPWGTADVPEPMRFRALIEYDREAGHLLAAPQLERVTGWTTDPAAEREALGVYARLGGGRLARFRCAALALALLLAGCAPAWTPARQADAERAYTCDPAANWPEGRPAWRDTCESEDR